MRSSSLAHVFLSYAVSISSHREPNPALNRTLRDKAEMKRAAMVAAVIVGLVIATWHVTVAMKALLVFRENEPLTSWLALFLGPGLTVLGCLLALGRPFAGGATVLAGGLLSAAAFLIGEGGRTEYITPYLFQFTAPMLAIGIALIALSRLRTHQDAGNAT